MPPAVMESFHPLQLEGCLSHPHPPRTRARHLGTFFLGKQREGRNGRVKLGIRKVLCCTVVPSFKVVLDFRIENVFC